MAEAIPVLTRHDLEAKIVKRCWEDEAFRKEFTADPAGAFTKYLEVPAKDVPKVVVFEETPGSWHVVIPAKPANADELSEADLEKVAGASVSPIMGSYVVSGALLSGSLLSGGIATAAFPQEVAAGVSGVVDQMKGW